MSVDIVVVEDDYLQEAPLKEELRRQFPDVRIRTLCTESEFHSRLAELRRDPPDLVVMDVMLRWADPSPDAPPAPDDVDKDGFYRAGLRCAALLAADEALRDVPVVLLTILERSDLERTHTDSLTAGPGLASYVRKSADFHGLIRRVHELLGPTAPAETRGRPASSSRAGDWRRQG